MLQYKVDEAAGFLHITSDSTIGYRDIKDLFQNMLRSPNLFGSHLRCITDFSDTTCTLTQKEIRKLKRLFDIKVQDFHIRHAHITNPQEELKASVFFAILGEDRDDIHTCIFQNKDLAENWLGFKSDLEIHHYLQNGLWN